MLASTFFCFPTYNNRATRQCRTYVQKNSSTEISGLGWTHDHFSALFGAPQSLKATLSELLRAKDLRVLSVVPLVSAGGQYHRMATTHLCLKLGALISDMQ
jgi:hypothetical protein